MFTTYHKALKHSPHAPHKHHLSRMWPSCWDRAPWFLFECWDRYPVIPMGHGKDGNTCLRPTKPEANMEISDFWCSKPLFDLLDVAFFWALFHLMGDDGSTAIHHDQRAGRVLHWHLADIEYLHIFLKYLGGKKEKKTSSSLPNWFVKPVSPVEILPKAEFNTSISKIKDM